MIGLSNTEIFAIGAVWIGSLAIVLFRPTKDSDSMDALEIAPPFPHPRRDPCVFREKVHGLSSADSIEPVLLVEGLANPAAERWSADDLRESLRVGCQLGVYESAPDIIAGYVLFLLVPGKRVEIVRLCVRQTHQRHKIGTKLIDWILKGADVVNAKEIVCEVPEKNLPMQLFLRQQNFRAVETLKDEPLGNDITSDLYRFRFDLSSICGEAASLGRSTYSRN